MRIGFDTLIENPLNPSSAINYLQTVLRALAEDSAGHELFVFVSPKNRHLFETDAPNVHLVNCFVSNEQIVLRILVQQLYVPLLAWRYRLDVIHALNQIPLLAPCATVVKVCTLHHHVSPEEFKTQAAGTGRFHFLRMHYRRWMIDASARSADVVIANSEATRDAITSTMGIAAEKICVVYESVDDRFGSIDVQKAQDLVRREFGISRGYVLYVSNLWHYKNPGGAIEAFASLFNRYGDDLTLVIAGSDDYNQIANLGKLARDRGVADRVLLTGKVRFEKLLALYAAARVVFYPSRAETFGKPVVEAMKSRVPVVTSNTTSLPELVGSAGLLVDPSDTAGLADALHRAATDSRLREELIAAGTERGRFFSWQNTARGTIEACLTASGHAKPSPAPAKEGL
jgi:glycosyltransferase involved in cell wall biosynthesis